MVHECVSTLYVHNALGSLVQALFTEKTRYDVRSVGKPLPLKFFYHTGDIHLGVN